VKRVGLLKRLKRGNPLFRRNFSPVTSGTHLVLRLTIGACQRLTPRASVVALGIQMSDSTQMTGTIGCRGNGGWFVRIISRYQRSARQRAIDARLCNWPTSRRIRGSLYQYTMCKRIAKYQCWNGAISALPCKRECCLRTPASQNGRREAVSLHKRPPFRNVGPSGSDHQRGNVEKAGVEACGADGYPGKHGVKRSLSKPYGKHSGAPAAQEPIVPRSPTLSCGRRSGLKAVTWLILPVVICLSQRLSHACLSINCFIL